MVASTVSVTDEGATFTWIAGGGVGMTCTSAYAPVAADATAIRTTPAFLPSTTPLSLTVATVVSDDDHCILRLMDCNWLS